eukprot:2783114-Rhodomonas_salina.1
MGKGEKRPRGERKGEGQRGPATWMADDVVEAVVLRVVANAMHPQHARRAHGLGFRGVVSDVVDVLLDIFLLLLQCLPLMHQVFNLILDLRIVSVSSVYQLQQTEREAELILRNFVRKCISEVSESMHQGAFVHRFLFSSSLPIVRTIQITPTGSEAELNDSSLRATTTGVYLNVDSLTSGVVPLCDDRCCRDGIRPSSPVDRRTRAMLHENRQHFRSGCDVEHQVGATARIESGSGSPRLRFSRFSELRKWGSERIVASTGKLHGIRIAICALGSLF